MKSHEPEDGALQDATLQDEGPGLWRSLRVADLEVGLELLPREQVLRAEPAAGARDLAQVGGATVGVWEHTPGTSADVEVDEVCLILSGRGTVIVHDEDSSRDLVVELTPGTLLRLHQGERTTWVVEEPLRKIYVVGGPGVST